MHGFVGLMPGVGFLPSRSWIFVGGLFVLSLLVNVLMLAGPVYMMQVYDRVLGSRSGSTLVVLTAIVLGLYAFLAAFETLRSKILLEFSVWLNDEVSASLVRTTILNSAPYSSAGPLRDLDQVRQFYVSQAPIALFDAPWIFVYIAFLFILHAYFAVLALLGVFALLVLTLLSELSLRAPLRSLEKHASSRNQIFEAGRRNADAIRSMGMLGSFIRVWQRQNSTYSEEYARTSRAAAVNSSVSKVFRTGLQSGVLALGAWLAIADLASPGAMIAASIITARALAPIEIAITHWRSYLSARQAESRLISTLERASVARNESVLATPRRTLTVQNLTLFSESQQVVIRDVNFTASAGEAIGVIGPSGVGKTTLARVVTGASRSYAGYVKLDGADIRQYDDDFLGQSVGFLPQGVELFEGTVSQNIARLNDSVDADGIREAAVQAGAHDFILSLPQGYDTSIGPDGGRLSSGQRQRIGLARALYGNPFLVVLDEPNAHLDGDGERALDLAIRGAKSRGAVVVVVAHRPSALTSVDKVLLLAEARQIAFGPKDEVLRKTLPPAQGAA